MATGAPGNRRAVPRRATCARTRPTERQRRSDPARTGRSEADRRRMGARAAVIAAAKADDGATAPRPSPGTQWHPLGRAFGLLLARDAEGVWEMGGRLQTVSALVRSGSVATDRGGVGKRRNESVAVGRVFGTAGGRPDLPPVLPYNRVTKAVPLSTSRRLPFSLVFETIAA